MRILNYLILLTFLVGCSDTRPFDLKYLSIEIDYQSKNTILNEFMLPLREYKSKSEEVLHLEVERDYPLFFTTNFINVNEYDAYEGRLSDQQIEHAISNEFFKCRAIPRSKGFTMYDIENIDYVDSFELKVRGITRLYAMCTMGFYENTDAYLINSKPNKASTKYPGNAKSKIIVLLPSNPLDEVIPLLNQMGYSPYNNWDRETTDVVKKRFNFNNKRDTYDLGFVNEDQSGIRFFWNNEEEITNLVFSIRKSLGDDRFAIDSIDDLENISEIISKLISVKQDVVFSSLFCRFYSSHKDIKQAINCNDFDINKIGKYFLKTSVDSISNEWVRKDDIWGEWIVSIYLK